MSEIIQSGNYSVGTALNDLGQRVARVMINGETHEHILTAQPISCLVCVRHTMVWNLLSLIHDRIKAGL